MKILVYSYLLLLSFWSPKQGIEGYLREAKGNQMGVEKYGNSKGRPMFGRIYLFKDLNKEDLVEFDQFKKHVFGDKEKDFVLFFNSITAFSISESIATAFFA